MNRITARTNTNYRKVGGLWLTRQDAVARVESSCVPLLATTDCADWPLRFLGSAFLYSYGGRRLVVFTKHQLLGAAPKDLAIVLSTDSSRLVRGAGLCEFQSPPNADDEFGQICALEFPWSWSQTPGVSQGFLHRPDAPAWSSPSSYMVIGFPEDRRVLHGDDMMQSAFYIRKRIVGTLQTSWLSNLPYLKTSDISRVGGFSGGPVFEVDGPSSEILFRGIVITGSNGILRFVPWIVVDELAARNLLKPSKEVIRIDEVPLRRVNG